MRPAILSLTLVCFTALVVHGIQQASPTGQEDKTPRPAIQQESTDSKLPGEMKFKLLSMGNGITDSGASFGSDIYETGTHTKLYLTILHLESRERAKNEYDVWLKRAVRIVSQGKVQDHPAT